MKQNKLDQELLVENSSLKPFMLVQIEFIELGPRDVCVILNLDVRECSDVHLFEFSNIPNIIFGIF